MPLPSKLVVFGDSNIAAVRHAYDAGLLSFEGYEVEFWGAAGPEYRHIHYNNGALRPMKPEAKKQVLMVNGHGREVLRPDDFDVFVFYGVRLRLAEFFSAYLDLLLDPERAVSEAALARAAAQFLQERRAVRMAAMMKADGAKRIVFVYAGFPCWGVVDHAEAGGLLESFPRVVEASAALRERLWGALAQAFDALGLELVRQPEETVVQGMFTDAAYAVAGAGESGDAIHKAPGYPAKVLEKRFGAQKAP